LTNVYIWFNGSEGVGHTSMLIAQQTYVSYWPGGGGADAKKDIKLKQTHEAAWMSGLRADQRLERRAQDATISLDGLDEAAMIRAFLDLKASAPRYNMRKHNCSTVIAYLLEIGSKIPAPFTPRVDLTQFISGGLKRQIVRLATLGGVVQMWSPRTVHDYAIAIASKSGKA